jgi:hypothetical protein
LKYYKYQKTKEEYYRYDECKKIEDDHTVYNSGNDHAEQ